MNQKAMEKWESSWDPSVHKTEYAAKRINSAKSEKLTPIKIDYDDLYGYFQGSHGRYETWLDLCPCVDFHRSKLPCKHIYRLAIELGVLDETAATDPNAIPSVRSKKINVSDLLDIVETLSTGAQQTLLTIASSTTSEKPYLQIDADPTADELLKSGIIVEDGTGISETINFGTKAKIIDFLQKQNIEHKKNDKKDILEKLCMTTSDPRAAAKHFGVHHWYNVRIPANYSRQQIHYYLYRKNYCKWCETVLPDDKITDELIKRGFYKRPFV